MTGFEHADEEETYNGLVDWLRKHREGWAPSTPQYYILDRLLDEARDAGVEGFLPWQR